MSNIEELIQQLSPEGVEFKELGKLATIETGTQLNKTAMTDIGDYPVLNGGINPSGYYNLYNTEVDTIAISQGGASAGYVNFMKTKFWAGAHCFVVKPTNSVIDNKFVYYLLKNDQEKLMNAKLGAGIPGLNKKELTTYKIPLAPLPIQQEIVTILDKFTQLEAELEAELEVRKKQYKYYRNELLNFEGKEVEWKTLGEVSKILRGTAITEKETITGEFPVVANAPNPIYLHGKSNRSGETIVIARSGAYSGLVSYWNKPLFLTDAFSIHPNNTLFKTKFVYYFLKKEQEKIHHMKKGSGVPHVRAKDFDSYSVPIPPIAEQEKIVAILDKFDALINDISVGLPAEIKARCKQYEYYRGKLLDFKNINNG